MNVKNVVTSILLLVINGVSGAASAQDGVPLPRFAPPRQEFDSSVHSGAGVIRECRQVFKPKRTAMPKEVLADGFDQWGRQSNYPKRKLLRLFNIEMSLPVELVTYIRLKHKTDDSMSAHIRIFAGETAEGVQVPLVMERKDRMLKLEKGERNFELGVLTKTDGLGEVTGPLLDKVIQHLSMEVDVHPYRIMMWATARPAQARLYEPLGFTPTGQLTKDGMLVMKASLQDLQRARGAKSSDEQQLMTREEYLRIREDSKVTSGHVREWYRKFWENEETLATAPDGETLQYELQATMRPTSKESNWIFSMGPESDGHGRMQSERGQDLIRYHRRTAALLVIEDRKAMGLGTSPALRRIAYYSLDWRNGHRYNEFFTVSHGEALSSIGGFGVRIVRRIPTANYWRDHDRTNQYQRELDRDYEREAADLSLREPWQRR